MTVIEPIFRLDRAFVDSLEYESFVDIVVTVRTGDANEARQQQQRKVKGSPVTAGLIAHSKRFNLPLRDLAHVVFHSFFLMPSALTFCEPRFHHAKAHPLSQRSRPFLLDVYTNRDRHSL